MTTKVNILIDAGFFNVKFKEREGKYPKADDVVNEVKQIMNLMAQKAAGETKDILMRVYYYDCRPFGETRKSADGTMDIDFSANKSYLAKEHFLQELCKKERMAVRLGDLSFDGWRDGKPVFKQKGVDMKVGLDMATMGIKHTIDKIVLVAGDSDFVTPMKFVRKEGIQVYLYSMGHNVKGKLIEHSDFILS